MHLLPFFSVNTYRVKKKRLNLKLLTHSNKTDVSYFPIVASIQRNNVFRFVREDQHLFNYFISYLGWVPHGQLWDILKGDSFTHPMLTTVAVYNMGVLKQFAPWVLNWSGVLKH